MGGLLTRSIWILALTTGMLGSGFAYAQATPEQQQESSPANTVQKIGYVDMKVILDNAPQVVAGRDAMGREFRSRNDAVLADKKRLAAMRERLDENMDADTKTQLERAIRTLDRATTRRREDLIEDLNISRNKIYAGVQEILEIAIQIVAEQQGFDLVIIDPAVLYHSQKVDLTNALLKQLRLEYAADQQEQASR